MKRKSRKRKTTRRRKTTSDEADKPKRKVAKRCVICKKAIAEEDMVWITSRGYPAHVQCVAVTEFDADTEF